MLCIRYSDDLKASPLIDAEYENPAVAIREAGDVLVQMSRRATVSCLDLEVVELTGMCLKVRDQVEKLITRQATTPVTSTERQSQTFGRAFSATKYRTPGFMATPCKTW